MGHISVWFSLMVLIYWKITFTTKKNTKSELDAVRTVGLEVNTDNSVHTV